MDGRDGAPSLFVTVGTDKHPFDRLIRWMDRWLVTADPEPRCLMQTGMSVVPVRGQHRMFLTYPEMEESISQADVVVCHGGPGTIATCWRLGRRPIVVPRLHEFGEHVDRHQLLFTRRLALGGDILLAQSEVEFGGLVSQACADHGLGRLPADYAHGSEQAVERFARYVDPLLLGRPRRLPRRVRSDRAGH
jgi:UDP-N-acetylglucosamine transferase subunit ALG13